jgi:hypothetical protein
MNIGVNRNAMANKTKIFGIGFQKTGTSSLNRALQILGFDAVGGIRINHPKGITLPAPLQTADILAVALARAKQADAFNDNPWPLLYREMDKAFPGAKFILTVRDSGRWLESLVRHFGDTANDVMRWIYGVPFPKGHEAQILRVYQAHNDAVRNYFAARPSDFLEMDFEQGDGWQKLCPFLGCAVPRVPFPHDNRGQERERKQRGLWRRFKNTIREIIGRA